MSQQQVQYVTAARNHEFHESKLNHLRKKKQTNHMLLSRSTVLSSVFTEQKGFQVTDTKQECLHVGNRLVLRKIRSFLDRCARFPHLYFSFNAVLRDRFRFNLGTNRP